MQNTERLQRKHATDAVDVLDGQGTAEERMTKPRRILNESEQKEG